MQQSTTGSSRRTEAAKEAKGRGQRGGGGGAKVDSTLYF